MKGFTQLALLAASATLGQAAFREGCADAPWDSDTDFFLTKFEKSPTNPFLAEYNKTYVTIKNRQSRYVVLYCSKEPPPTSIVGESSLFVKAPVKNVAALDGFSQNLIEMLGMSTSLKRTGVYSDVTSSCIRGNMKDNITFDDDEWDKAPEVDVTFYGDTATSDNKKVLIYNVGNYAPLAQLGYIKFVSMFFGLEELGEKLYDEISANYRCAAAQVQQAIMAGTYPTGALISPIRKDGDKFTVFQSAWWNSILSDAGSALVNVSADGQASETGNPTKPGLVTIDANSAGNNFARNSWAIIDTTQYDQLPGKQAPKTLPESTRITADTYTSRSGASSASYAVKKNNVWLTDKAANRNRRHNFFDRGSARPDQVIRDIISIVSPSFLPDYSNMFIRSVSKPDDEIALRRFTNTCAEKGKELETLNLTKCDAPAWVAGYHDSGLKPNAYRSADQAESLALRAGGSGLSGGQKAGIAVGSVVGFLLLAAAAGFGIYKCRRARAGDKNAKRSEMDQVEKGSVSSRSTH
ncbi:periplasmic binding protein [Metarhizium robertsii ARSEF 23]|uniref:Periplasmic binding protein n=1 Tax=Metarhizium robertsii (strain ARSEF 23 / ATCC MYA-3075) TaxID=655844 RepID=E9FDE0_METRA|nr:periplasmic binding protein [Metarhizium robertsii ARSEF 23]EFY94254.1 periplasmic binding protein [Metarhizium robertsii ARSEF 23]